MTSTISTLIAGLARLPGPWTIILSLGVASLVGGVDYATGYDLHVTAFYLVPICWASWASGRKAGLFLAAACTVMVEVAEWASRHPEIPRLVPIWNTLMLLVVFVGAACSVSSAVSAYKSLAEAQTSLREANEYLEEKVQRRTSALRSEIAERQRLEQVKAHAERLLERQEKLATLGTLTAGIAHEIRNPLTSIKARLYTLEKHLNAVPPARRDTDIISSEISRLERIVREALSFARPADPKLEPIAAETLLHEVQGLMAPTLEARNVNLVVEPGPALIAYADSGHIKQVLINLIRNGADAIEKSGTVSLRSRAAQTSLGGRETSVVILEVSDTGKGIPADVEKRLFDPFFTTKETGTGLGLPIALRMVEKQGGKIEYQTQCGQGTTFRVVLPRKTGDIPGSGEGSKNSAD